MQNTRIIALASPRFVLPAGLTNIFVSSLASFFALARFAFSRASSASWSARFTCTGIMAHWTAGRALVLVDGVPPADWRPFFCGAGRRARRAAHPPTSWSGEENGVRQTTRGTGGLACRAVSAALPPGTWRCAPMQDGPVDRAELRRACGGRPGCISPEQQRPLAAVRGVVRLVWGRKPSQVCRPRIRLNHSGAYDALRTMSQSSRLFLAPFASPS